MLIKCAAMHIQHMQKALTQMNLKLQHVISDITGVTGMKILHAIVAGERDVSRLAEMKEPGIKSSKEVIGKALEGDYRREHLFTLGQALELYKSYREKIVACDREIEERLQRFEAKLEVDEATAASVGKKRRRGGGGSSKIKVMRRNEPAFNCEAELLRMTGVDLTSINGISASTALLIVSEIGMDMSKWKTEKHFASWLGLSPDKRISGGRVLSSHTRNVTNRVATALRISAQSLLNSDSALGAYCRRMQWRLGSAGALIATAHKLARLVYHMLKYGGEYVDAGKQYYEEKYKERALKGLSRRARQLGFVLVPHAGLTPVVA
jgi:transposase